MSTLFVTHICVTNKVDLVPLPCDDATMLDRPIKWSHSASFGVVVEVLATSPAFLTEKK